MIKFTDGTEITWEEAAGMIEDEGRLIPKSTWTSEGRCVWGVLGNAQKGSTPKIIKDRDLLSKLITSNNKFVGSPEERAMYMAAWCRAQGDSELQDYLGNKDEETV